MFTSDLMLWKRQNLISPDQFSAIKSFLNSSQALKLHDLYSLKATMETHDLISKILSFTEEATSSPKKENLPDHTKIQLLIQKWNAEKLLSDEYYNRLKLILNDLKSSEYGKLTDTFMRLNANQDALFNEMIQLVKSIHEQFSEDLNIWLNSGLLDKFLFSKLLQVLNDSKSKQYREILELYEAKRNNVSARILVDILVEQVSIKSQAIKSESDLQKSVLESKVSLTPLEKENSLGKPAKRVRENNQMPNMDSKNPEIMRQTIALRVEISNLLNSGSIPQQDAQRVTKFLSLPVESGLRLLLEINQLHLSALVSERLEALALVISYVESLKNWQSQSLISQEQYSQLITRSSSFEVFKTAKILIQDDKEICSEVLASLFE
jgi:hypothetical protein